MTARPRYGRISAAAAAAGVTVVTLVAGYAGSALGAGTGDPARGGARPVAASVPSAGSDPSAVQDTGPTPGSTAQAPSDPPSASATAGPGGPPPRSGVGRRVVFDQSSQRVWLVERGGRVVDTYLVSGSTTDNLQPGRYSVYSRSARAWGVDDSGEMEFMVRFTSGEVAAIGFHSIPVLDGEPVQTRAELGTPQSHGCIRQWRPDAKALWRFAPLGTKVVVTA